MNLTFKWNYFKLLIRIRSTFKTIVSLKVNIYFKKKLKSPNVKLLRNNLNVSFRSR